MGAVKSMRTFLCCAQTGTRGLDVEEDAFASVSAPGNIVSGASNKAQPGAAGSQATPAPAAPRGDKRPAAQQSINRADSTLNDAFFDAIEQHDWFLTTGDASGASSSASSSSCSSIAALSGDGAAGELAAACRNLDPTLAAILLAYHQCELAPCKAVAALLAWCRAAAEPPGELAARLAADGSLQPLLARQRGTLRITSSDGSGSPDCSRSGSPSSASPTAPPALPAASGSTSDASGVGAAPPAPYVAGGYGDTSLLALLQRAAVAQSALEGVADRSGYHQVSSGPLRIYYRHQAGSGLHSFKTHCVLEEPLEHVACLAREVDLVTSWNSAMLQGEELHALSDAEAIFYLAVWVPWPLAAPELLFHGVALDLLSVERCVLGVFDDITTLPPGVSLPAYNGRRDRMPIQDSCFRFEPLPPNPLTGAPRTAATVLVHVDAGDMHVPDAVVSFILKVFAPLVYRLVLRVLRKVFHGGASGGARRLHSGGGASLVASGASAGSQGASAGSQSGGGSALQRRMEERGQLYTRLRRSVAAYLQRLAAAGDGNAAPAAVDGGAAPALAPEAAA